MTSVAIALLLCGLLLLVLAFTLPSKEKLMLERTPPMPIEGDPNLPVPMDWDETALTYRIASYSDKPDLLTRFIDGVRDRLITGQNIKTVQKRTQFLRIQLEHLKTAKELHNILFTTYMCKFDRILT